MNNIKLSKEYYYLEVLDADGNKKPLRKIKRDDEENIIELVTCESPADAMKLGWCNADILRDEIWESDKVTRFCLIEPIQAIWMWE